MKKVIGLIAVILMFAGNAWAENRTSVKGGWNFAALEGDVYGHAFDSDTVDVEDGLFIEIIPMSAAAKLFDTPIGIRAEPVLGYSEQSFSYAGEQEEGPGLAITGEFKEFYVGGNLFGTVALGDRVELYGGPFARVNFVEVDAEFDYGRGEMIKDSGIDFNFAHGVEAGAEFKVTKAVSVGGFYRRTFSDPHLFEKHQFRADKVGEDQVGASVNVYW